jgi:uncharacterized protein
MPGHYFRNLFGDEARTLQQHAGSRGSYSRREAAAEGLVDPLSDHEIAFIVARDSFYIASVTTDGWPYVQHRGGAAGFVKSLGRNRLGFVDYRGNRQYISAGNLLANARVALFFMDYPARRRLKLIGHAAIVELADAPELVDSEAARSGERAVLIDVVGFDWNCPQHIAPRYTRAEFSLDPLPDAGRTRRDMRSAASSADRPADGERDDP